MCSPAKHASSKDAAHLLAEPRGNCLVLAHADAGYVGSSSGCAPCLMSSALMSRSCVAPVAGIPTAAVRQLVVVCCTAGVAVMHFCSRLAGPCRFASQQSATALLASSITFVCHCFGGLFSFCSRADDLTVATSLALMVLQASLPGCIAQGADATLDA